MANDKSIELRSIELRVALLEHEMETLVDMVEEIRQNYVTKAYLKEYLDERLSHFATKEDLQRMNQSLRNWVLTIVLSCTGLQFAVQYAMFQLYVHAH